MQSTKAWFERKFDSSIPLELFPNVLARLRGTPARMEDLVRECSTEVLTAKPDQKWSAQEHLGHLLDLESLWLARVADFRSAKEQLTPADLTNRGTHEANHNGHPVSRILADFRIARAALLRSVEPLNESDFLRALPHPRLKTPMRLLDHLHFVAEHDDHHLAQAWALIQAPPAGRG